MRKIKKSVLTKSFLLFGAAAVLLLTSTVGSTRAALTYRSESYGMQIEVPSIGVSLLENGQVVSSRDYVGNDWKTGGDKKLLQSLIPVDLKKSQTQKLSLGEEYKEELRVQNTGAIDSYVRVIVYRSWTKGGQKNTELSPELIQMDLGGDGWVVDNAASTRERTILYYKDPLKGDPDGKGEGGITSTFNTKFSIDQSVGNKVTEKRTTTSKGEIIETTFAYHGYEYNVSVEVDAVQTHNAEDAIRSAWGVDMSVLTSGGTGG